MRLILSKNSTRKHNTGSINQKRQKKKKYVIKILMYQCKIWRIERDIGIFVFELK